MGSYIALVDKLQQNNTLRTRRIIEAFKLIDRSHFLPVGQTWRAGDDVPLPIDHGQTNSQPTTVAFMLELLEPLPGQKILDIGSGSGWTTGLLSYITGKGGKVYGIERIPELVEFGRDNLARLDIKNATMSQSGDELGLPNKSPFDRILVSASADELPKTLIDQLSWGGILVLPIGGVMHRIEKDEHGDIADEQFPGFAFVPLIK